MFEFIVKIFVRFVWEIIINGYGAFLRWIAHYAESHIDIILKMKIGRTSAYSIFGIVIPIVLLIYFKFRNSN
ncbi:MAG: hypothetical protein K0Q79_252 [Flavipsychrobacter sp.]|jgi:hypothetical protein|nr:hypothetical protein [Flavipsychrobacter sp.]